MMTKQPKTKVSGLHIRKLLVLLALAAVTSAVISYYSKPLPFYEKLIRIQAEQELAPIDERITHEPLAIQATLLDYFADKELTLKAWLALSKYPDQTRNILGLYGSEREFKDILRTHGDAIIPVIQYFLDHEVKSLVVMQKTQRAIQTVTGYAQNLRSRVTGNAPAGPVATAPPPPPELGPTERGWYAVNFIKKEGYSFLAEFEVDKNKQTHWIQTIRFTDALMAFFTGEVRNLETKYVLKEDIGAGDIFFAGVDAIPLAVSVKLLRAGKLVVASEKAVGVSEKVVVASGKELSLVSRTRIFAARLIPRGAFFAKFGKFGAAVATAYIVFAHPSLVNSLLAELADVLGINPLLVQFAGWFLIVTIVLYPFSWVLKNMARAIIFGISRLERLPRKKVTKTTNSSTPRLPRRYMYRRYNNGASEIPA